MDYGDVICQLRRAAGLTQARVAHKVGDGISQPQVSQIEHSRQCRVSSSLAARLEHVLALGAPQKDEEAPCYALSGLGPGLDFAVDADGRFGIYRGRDAAVLATRMTGFARLQLQAVPLWLGFAARLAFENEWEPRRIDIGTSRDEVLRSISEHVYAVLTNLRSHVEEVQAAAAPAADEESEIQALTQTLLAAAAR